MNRFKKLEKSDFLLYVPSAIFCSFSFTKKQRVTARWRGTNASIMMSGCLFPEKKRYNHMILWSQKAEFSNGSELFYLLLSSLYIFFNFNDKHHYLRRLICTVFGREIDLLFPWQTHEKQVHKLGNLKVLKILSGRREAETWYLSCEINVKNTISTWR